MRAAHYFQRALTVLQRRRGVLALHELVEGCSYEPHETTDASVGPRRDGPAAHVRLKGVEGEVQVPSGLVRPEVDLALQIERRVHQVGRLQWRLRRASAALADDVAAFHVARAAHTDAPSPEDTT